ncbi:YvrJ family protein [Alkalihalobacillus sp. AL-G]|uniref:YvrJ family protein n=1 Tax=Alkalihalobacillus sp. AL-G TaxID=2926399 RepID=UPI00272A2A62|nr:YvrJ family protein [Alkalihalobacillus sp. AL-G]WLD93226.1 YvrJ family protein [Alkalihalobacillus sp. AL-G]
MLDGTSIVGWFNLIPNVGFPAVVALYLLLQNDKRLYKLEQSIEVLSELIQKQRGEEHDEPASVSKKRKAK